MLQHYQVGFGRDRAAPVFEPVPEVSHRVKTTVNGIPHHRRPSWMPTFQRRLCELLPSGWLFRRQSGYANRRISPLDGRSGERKWESLSPVARARASAAR